MPVDFSKEVLIDLQLSQVSAREQAGLRNGFLNPSKTFDTAHSSQPLTPLSCSTVLSIQNHLFFAVLCLKPTPTHPFLKAKLCNLSVLTPLATGQVWAWDYRWSLEAQWSPSSWGAAEQRPRGLSDLSLFNLSVCPKALPVDSQQELFVRHTFTPGCSAVPTAGIAVSPSSHHSSQRSVSSHLPVLKCFLTRSRLKQMG